MLNILLVDDSPLMRQFVARSLSMTEFEISIRHADDGRTGIHAARALRPDLIISDLNMPEMSGEEMVEQLLSDPALCDIPVVILTADGERSRAEGLLHHGNVHACLRKPVRPEDLRQQLAKLSPMENTDSQLERSAW